MATTPKRQHTETMIDQNADKLIQKRGQTQKKYKYAMAMATH